ncbi:uncharacterized protein LTHEOB_6454 [Lasiodiplodia theobromae]|uniref:uncharacterized protein n=1 Tax=Lasiodiplodia theobromae TaxID=45133 RepID=UPI0015C3234B|nr:uncharacterized protein LTHEOB_6454 [Lasiodiplodia theobromae]KAF4544336.1 hypothetical protein LTHEOB_6454 [Lasiodiplodia theobromae]
MPKQHLRRVPGRSNLRSTPTTTPTTTTPTAHSTPSLRRIPKDPNLRSSYTNTDILVPAPLRIHKATPTSTSAAATARVSREEEAKTKEIEDEMIKGKTQAAILEAGEETGVEWWVPDVCF